MAGFALNLSYFKQTLNHHRLHFPECPLGGMRYMLNNQLGTEKTGVQSCSMLTVGSSEPNLNPVNVVGCPELEACISVERIN